MRKVILDINEMSDSKEVYGQRPNPFVSIFIYCLVALFTVAVIYACFGKMEIVATATGIVRPNDDVSTVASLISGRVIYADYSDGRFVQKGDILLSVDVSDKQISLSALEKSNEENKKQLELLEKFLKGVQSGKNPFSSAASSEEYPYYIQYQDYQLALKNTAESYEYDAEKNTANMQATEDQIDDLLDKLAGLKAYKKSVQQEEDLASSYPTYENMYLLYISELNTLERDYQTKREIILSDDSEAVNKSQLEQYQTMVTEYGYLVQSIQKDESVFPIDDTSICKLQYDEYLANIAVYQESGAEANTTAYKAQAIAEYQQVLTEYKSKAAALEASMAVSQSKEEQLSSLDLSYSNSREQQYLQTITQIDSAIQSAQIELDSAQSNLQLYQITKDLYKKSADSNGRPLSISMATVEQISSILARKETLLAQVDELDAQLQQLKEQVAQGTIKAEQSGIISVNATLIRGDMITAGTTVATIIPYYESEYKVNLYVSNADIANIAVGDAVHYNLSALPSSQYGVIDGVVTKISSDTLVRDGQYSGYYLVEASIAGQELTDKDGNSGSISIGMQLEAKIVTQEKTIFRYMLEKINLF